MAFFASLSSAVSKLALSGLVLAALATSSMEASAWSWRGAPDAASSPATSVALAELPPQGRKTYQAILNGGPFKYDKDGSVFGNRERLLPSARRGHYREYTVDTPGLRHRGARRIICGGASRPPEVCWYTADHYASFRRIVP